MYKVGKVVDQDVLEELTLDYTSNPDIWSIDQSRVSKDGGDGSYDNSRTSKNFFTNHLMHPEFCEQLEDFAADGSKVNQIDILLYEKGDKFSIHRDVIDNDHIRRRWSTTTILDLSDDFVGDGLALYETNKAENIENVICKIPRQEVGDTIIFRSDVYHEARPVVQGTRLVAVAWLGYE
jgi:predicted 2-oxoglutarate/Fe(II)-dependent dioxygenase YbiX